MNWFRKQGKPNFDFSPGELKILRAVWLKNAPMSFEEIIGACESEWWARQSAGSWLDSLLEKGALLRQADGRYDAALSFSQYQAALRKHRPISKVYIPAEDQGFSEYDLREMEKLLERRLAELAAEKRKD